ncbi:MAG: MarC family protein [Acidobacteriota bacterium]|nr:MarC family protein [Acidobacteriota bacterium]
MNPAALAEFSLVAFSSVFFLVDPFAAIPSFLVMTAGATAGERRKMARKASITCFCVLTGFALAGGMIFKLFGITLPALKIAGGLLLFVIGMEMLQARQSGTKESPGETEEARRKKDVGIIPLGIPLLAGPGAISSVMVLMGQSPNWWQAAPVFIAIAVTCLCAFLILAAADRISRMLGETGIHILMRMMGLLLTAIAVQFVINGLGDIGLVSQKH